MLFFFFNQKTAYEMRISDWSSDVCSSDLDRVQQQPQREPGITLFAQHLEIARMIGARMFLINRRFVVLRGVGVIFARRSFDADMVLDKGIEAASQRVVLRIFPRPRPPRDALRCRLVGSVVAARLLHLGKGLRSEETRGG